MEQLIPRLGRPSLHSHPGALLPNGPLNYNLPKRFREADRCRSRVLHSHDLNSVPRNWLKHKGISTELSSALHSCAVAQETSLCLFCFLHFPSSLFQVSVNLSLVSCLVFVFSSFPSSLSLIVYQRGAERDLVMLLPASLNLLTDCLVYRFSVVTYKVLHVLKDRVDMWTCLVC